MKKVIAILTTGMLLLNTQSQGQCPQPKLWARLIYLRDSSKLHPREQLYKLFNILDSVRNCKYSDDSTYSFLLARIAKTHLDQGEYLKAVSYYRESIRVITLNSGKKSVNPGHLPGRYYWLSVVYDSLNNFREKMEALDSCFVISMRLNYIDRSSLTALYSRVEYFFDVGDYQKCIDYAARCESLAQVYANTNTGVEEKAGKFFVSSSVGWHAKALLKLEKFEKAEELLKNKIGEYSKEGLKNYLGMIYGQLAEVQEHKSNYEKALYYSNRSLKCYQEIKDYFNCKQTLKDIGYNIYFRHFNDCDKALAYYKKALTYANRDKSKNTADVFESLSIFANIANMYVQKGHYDSAYKYFQIAFDQIKPGINENAILHTSAEEFIKYKKIHYLTSLQIDKGDAFQKQYKSTGQKIALQKAIRVYKNTDQLLDRIKTGQSELDSKLFWRSDSKRLYEHAIEACLLNDDIDNAFYFFEKSRSVLLNDQLNEQRWLGEADIMKQTQLNKKILKLERELDTSDKSSSHNSELENELFGKKHALENLKELIKTNNPLYYQNFLNDDSITVNDVQQTVLKDHHALVELFAGDHAVYILAITRQKSYFQKINKTIFDSLSTSFVSYISDQDFLNRNYNAFVQLSGRLYKLIFRNINLPAGRIIISPDGKNFPFEALVTNEKLVTYFLEDHAVSYTYSARYLLNRFIANWQLKGHVFMGIAPVQYSKGLSRLSGSDQSLERMKNYFTNTTNFVGSKASKNNFQKEYYKYKIIQLYTHATGSGYNGEPMIYFSDSILSLSELFYENKPATSLIVLSACETAEGKLYNGEGVFSFSRGFAALGIPSSVSNLWQVDNRATYRLTELFYKYLAGGMPLDLALQNAKKEFIKTSAVENKLPYYWAAPILVGTTNAIPLHKNFPWKWIAAIGTLVLAVFFAWRTRRTIFQRNADTDRVRT